jgi:hypothetical protein
MNKFCYSCGAPLDMPDFKGPAENYCKYCTDDSGNLKPRDEIKQGIAQWFKGWQPGVDDAVALDRAEYYMQSMPAWA